MQNVNLKDFMINVMEYETEKMKHLNSTSHFSKCISHLGVFGHAGKGGLGPKME